MSHSHPPYVAVESIDEACGLLEEYGPDAKVLAGGQSLSLLLRQNLLDPELIVDISDVQELGEIRVTDDAVRIGATTTYNQLKRHEVASMYPSLSDAVGVIADEQIRNVGTVGGAVAHADPSLDILPPLLCLDATLVVAGSDGQREVPFVDFYDGYMTTGLEEGEIVAGIEFETPARPQGSSYEKFANVEGGWATVGVGSRLTLSDAERVAEARIALAAVDDMPVRATSAEEILEGEVLSAETIEAAAAEIPEDIAPLGDIAGSPEYKESVATRLGERSLRRSLDRATGGVAP